MHAVFLDRNEYRVGKSFLRATNTFEFKPSGCNPGACLRCDSQSERIRVFLYWSVQASKELEVIIKEVNTNSNGYKADSARAEIVLSEDLVDSVNKQSKYEDNKTKDKDFLYRLIIDAPNDSQKASYTH